MAEIDVELNEATSAFVADDGNVKVSIGQNHKVSVGLSEIFKMYLEDFAGETCRPRDGKTQIALIQWIVGHASGEKQSLLSSVTSPEKLDGGIKWLPYDWATNGP